MKAKRSFLLWQSVGLLGLLPMFMAEATAQTKQETEIVDVLRAKSEAYFNGDLKKWQCFWLQDSSSSRAIITKSDYTNQIGWAAVVAGIAKDSQERGYLPVAITYENVHIRASGNLAFVEADERLSTKENPSAQEVVHTYTVLVKENKVWKIANQIRVGAGSFANTALNREYELNAMGYNLLAEKRIPEAIDVFLLTVKHNPNSWNAYDSLGEAYALAGETKLAIANYEKSLALNPKNDTAKTVLDKLKKGK